MGSPPYLSLCVILKSNTLRGQHRACPELSRDPVWVMHLVVEALLNPVCLDYAISCIPVTVNGMLEAFHNMH